jgi:hypothetical protein
MDEISRENVLRFSTPPYFTVIIRSLTILEGVALSVDPSFRLVRGAYPYVLRQLLFDDTRTPKALQKLLIRLLTVNGKGEEIEWERLRDFLRLAQRASAKTGSMALDSNSNKSSSNSTAISRQTIALFGRFLTSRTGLFLKKPLVHELAEAIDGMASIGEGNMLRLFPAVLLPGMNGPVNTRRMDEIGKMVETFREALERNKPQSGGLSGDAGAATTSRRLRSSIMEVLREVTSFLQDARFQQSEAAVLEELQSVIQMVAVEVLEIRGARAIRKLAGVAE